METSVNQYKFRLSGNEKYLNFPLELTSTNISQEEIIENNFVKKEVEKAINPIVDNDKIRYVPHVEKFDAGRVDYNINLLTENGVFPETTTLESIGFTNEDIRYRRNNFKRSFLNLMFFDSDVPTSQNFLGNITLYNRITRFDIQGTKSNEPIRGEGAPRGETMEEPRGTDVAATIDASITSGLFLGHKCMNIQGFFPQIYRYYLNGLKYNFVVETTWGEAIPDCATNGEIGTAIPVMELDFNIDIPYSFFSSYRKLPTTHTHNGSTYEVFVKWDTNILMGTKDLVGVYLRNITANSQGERGETYVPAQNEGELKDVGEIPLSFIVEDSVEYPEGFAEGYYLYHPVVDLPESIYMRANYNNAKTGISTDLMTTSVPQKIDDVLKKIHTKYNLKKDGERYYYEIDETYSDNVFSLEPQRGSARRGGFVGRISVHLYEIQVL